MRQHFCQILLFLCNAILLTQVKQISGVENLYAHLNEIIKHIILQAHKESLTGGASSPNTFPDITKRLQSILEKPLVSNPNITKLETYSGPKVHVNSHVNKANRDLTQQVTHCINSSCTIVHQKKDDDNEGQGKYHFHINGPIYLLHDSKHMPKLLKGMANNEKQTNDNEIRTQVKLSDEIK